MNIVIEKLRRKRRFVTALLVIYLLLVGAAVTLGIVYVDSPVGVLSLMVLGLPWSTVVTPCLWAVSHNSSDEGLLLMNALFTSPNIFLLVRWILKLYVTETSYVE